MAFPAQAGKGAREMAVATARLPGVISAAADPILTINDTIPPNDPYYVDDDDPGQDCDIVEDPNCSAEDLVDQWGLFQVEAESAWYIETGSPEVIIAVLDSGIDQDHDDLWENVWSNSAEVAGIDGVDDDGNGKVDDKIGYDFAGNNLGWSDLYPGSPWDDPSSEDSNPDIFSLPEHQWINDPDAYPYGYRFDGDPAAGDGIDNNLEYYPLFFNIDPGVFHGTATAGVAAMMANNINPDTGSYEGMVGACWHCTIMPVRMINAEGEAFGSDAAEAIYYAVDNGARVINASWGVPPGGATAAELEPIADAVRYAVANGVVFVAAAGNTGDSPDFPPSLSFPASMPETIAVGSSNWLDERSAFSSYALGDEVLDVTAPGELIWTSGVLSANDAWTLNGWILFPELWDGETYRPGDDVYIGADGTSFAAPLVSGYVGLILSQNPCATVDDVRNVLHNNAVDIQDPGYDNETGFGRIRMVVPDLGCEGQDAPPSVSIASPVEGETVSGTVSIKADASDDNGVAQVEFFVDGGSLGVDLDGPDADGWWSFLWNTVAFGEAPHTVSVTATDGLGQTASDSNDVLVNNYNDPPLASFSYECTGLDCSFDASTATDPDGSITGYSWDFGDTSAGSGVTTTHSYAPGGPYLVELTVTDNEGEIGQTSQEITLTDTTMHVGDLAASGTEEPRGRWSATVTILVHDGAHQPLPGVTVAGTWTSGISGDASCSAPTDDEGLCTVVRSNIKSNIKSVTYAVDTLTLEGYTYDSGASHDPNGDSDGIQITLIQPGTNTPPSATIASPADGTNFLAGATIDFNGSASDAEDGDISASLVWESDIDGPIGAGSGFARTLSDGAHTITATASDSVGATGSASVAIIVGTVQNTPAHVADLDGSSSGLVHGRWDASVTILVMGTGNPVAGASVTGTWGAGANGTGACTTDASGHCTTVKNRIKSNVPSVSFSVDAITGTGITYEPAANSDPDGDSDGTTLVIGQ